MQKKLFLAVCFCRDSGLSLIEMGKNFEIVGTIGYADSYLESYFGNFKVFRLHAILHDAARAAWSRSGKGPGYCYMVARGPNSWVLDHVSRLLFCPYEKPFCLPLPTMLAFEACMSGIVKDIELADKNPFKELGHFLMGMFNDTHYVLQRNINPQSKRFGVEQSFFRSQ